MRHRHFISRKNEASLPGLFTNSLISGIGTLARHTQPGSPGRRGRSEDWPEGTRKIASDVAFWTAVAVQYFASNVPAVAAGTFFVAAGVVDAEALASDVAFVAFVSDVAAFVAAACQLQ